MKPATISKLSKFENELQAIHDKNRGNLLTGLSRYGRTDLDEFLAESISEYLTSSKPRKIAKEVGELFDKYFKRSL